MFDRINGLVVGRAYGYNEARNEMLFEVLERRTSRSDLPVLANVDIGHTDPMLTLRLGAQARLGTEQLSFEILE